MVNKSKRHVWPAQGLPLQDFSSYPSFSSSQKYLKEDVLPISTTHVWLCSERELEKLAFYGSEGSTAPALQHTMGIPQKGNSSGRGEYREITNVHEVMSVSIAPLS